MSERDTSAQIMIAEPSDDQLIVAATDVLATEFGAEVVLLNLRDGVFHSLEDVGARIWRLIQEPVTRGGILETVVAEYDVDPERCERDVRQLLAQLAANGLIEVRSP